MIYLLKNGVPLNVQDEWSSARRQAAVILLRQMDGGSFDWDLYAFVEQS